MSTISPTAHPKAYFALAALAAILLAGLVVAVRPSAPSTTPPAPAQAPVVHASPFSPPAHVCFEGRPGIPNAELTRTRCILRRP
jgi:hypothetical protein